MTGAVTDKSKSLESDFGSVSTCTPSEIGDELNLQEQSEVDAKVSSIALFDAGAGKDDRRTSTQGRLLAQVSRGVLDKGWDRVSRPGAHCTTTQDQELLEFFGSQDWVAIRDRGHAIDLAKGGTKDCRRWCDHL